MFKLARVNKGSLLSELLRVSSEQQRSIRMRKPPWEPKAKSKLFRVPPEKPVDVDEYNYIVPIWREYKAQMRSVYQLFKTEFKFTDKASLKAQEEKRIKLKEEEALLELNDKINKQILEKQLVEEEIKLNEKKKQVEREYAEKLDLERTYKQIAEQKVRKLKEKAKSFIDPNNLEYEIEKMLNEKHDYNFSIDTLGRMYKGKSRLTREQAFDTTFAPTSDEANLNKSSLMEQEAPNTKPTA